jgi:hypothetical protein
METEIRFLQTLERDLTDVARAEARRLTASAPPRRQSHRRAWLGAVASLLVVAFAIGVLAQGGVRENAVNENAASFSTVGSAVGGAPGDQLGVFDPGKNPEPAASPNATQGGQTTGGVDLSKIVRDGAIVVTIPDGSFPDRSSQVTEIATSNGGSVLSSSAAGGDSGTFTLRIPAARFDKAMVQLGALGSVDSQDVRGQDVTAEFYDAKAHLKIYLSRRTVLFGLMAQANTIGETLTVANQLDQVQLRIDQIQGQLRYLNDQVAESTIKVDLHEPDAATPSADDINNPSLSRAFDRAVQGFMNVLAAVVIGLGYLIPLGVLAGIVALVVWGVRRRSRSGPPQTPRRGPRWRGEATPAPATAPR